MMPPPARFFVVGCYIAPNNNATVEVVRMAWAECPREFWPMLLGDLNINLRDPTGA